MFMNWSLDGWFHYMMFCVFQHVQKMVVSLATDKGVWDAVLANEQIQEFRTTLRAADGKHFLSLHGESIYGWFEVVVDLKLLG